MSSNKRYTVLTYLFGGYEDLKEIDNKDEDAEYICVTDNIELQSDTWRILPVVNGEEMNGFEKTLFVRYHPFLFCNTDIVITVDASIRILEPLKPIIDDFEDGNYDMGVMPHPLRCNLLDEYKTWILYRNYDTQQALDNCEFFKKYRYPINGEKDGLFEAGLLISRKSPIVSGIDKMTYRTCKFLVNEGIERIDQIVLTFVLNTFFSEVPTMYIAEDSIHSTLMRWYDHNGTPIPYEKKDRKYYRNGKEISVKIYG